MQTTRNRLAAQVEDLSRTLLDGHPRMAMARLRLADLDREVSTARERVDRVLSRRIVALEKQAGDADRRRRRTQELSAEREKLQADLNKSSEAVEVERRLLAELRRADEATTMSELPVEPVLEPEAAERPTAETPLEITELPASVDGRPVWPLIAGAALLGLLGSAAFVTVGSLRQPGRKRMTAPSVAPVAIPAAPGKPRGDGSFRSPAMDTASIDDVIGAIIASEISRAVVVTPEPTLSRPIATEIVRRLALRGHSVALIDVGGEQRSALAMGVPPGSVGLSDMASGEGTFAEAARRDFATAADVFPLGRQPEWLNERSRDLADAMEFVERNYETVIVDCGALAERKVADAMTVEAALLLATGSAGATTVEEAVAQLRASGFDDMVVVGEGT